MKNITFRNNFLNEVTLDDVVQYDLSSLSLNDYDWGPVEYYLVRDLDIARPDLISYRIYGTTNYWWFIMWFNGVGDVWNDLTDGMILKYPNIEVVRNILKICAKE